MKKRILSGIQPSGKLHIGNYLGAIKNWVELQNEYESFFCIVNLHAITLTQDPMQLRQNTLDLARIYLAAGIDPEISTIFIQSDVPEHSELAWVLACQSRMGELERMTQFKDKSKGKGEQVGVGIFIYPVLMAADILLYQSDLVPVGKDQKQHLELTRDLAIRFNRDFGETFRVPEPFIPEFGANIRSLQDPSKKMSKSDDAEAAAIYLMDSPENIRKKIRRAVTDSGTKVDFDPERPAIHNLLTIYKLLSGKTQEECVANFEGKGYGQFKAELAETVIEFLEPFQQKIRAIDDASLNEILKKGAERAREIASKTLSDVYKRIGLK
jgi:tryptophanyl-tRNA synthetase